MQALSVCSVERAGVREELLPAVSYWRCMFDRVVVRICMFDRVVVRVRSRVRVCLCLCLLCLCLCCVCLLARLHNTKAESRKCRL
jgi:hypothetical protein